MNRTYQVFDYKVGKKKIQLNMSLEKLSFSIFKAVSNLAFMFTSNQSISCFYILEESLPEIRRILRGALFTEEVKS